MDKGARARGSQEVKRSGPSYAPNPLRGGASKGADADFAPRLRDALTRGCLIFSRVCGPDAGRGRDTSPHGRDAITRAYAGIAHAKVAKDAKD